MKGCAYCHRVFQKTEHLLRHQRSHTGEKPFLCLECGRRYGRSDVLQRHLKSFHRQDGAIESRRKRPNNNTTAPARQTLLPVNPDASSPDSTAGEMAKTSDSDPPPLAMTDKPWSGRTRSGLETHRSACLQPVDITMAASLLPAPQQSGEIRTESHGEQLLQSRGDTVVNLANGVEWQPETQCNNQSLNDQINNYEVFMEDAQFSANVFDFLVNGGSMLESTDLSGAGSSSPGDRVAELLSTERASVIPTERFAKVARLWPHRMGPNAATRLEANLWKEVVAFRADNICTDPSPDPSNRDASGCDLAVDEDQRLALIREFAPGRGGKRTSNGSEVPNVTFPSTRLLNLGLGLAFRHPHLPLSFIHQPTFSIKRAPKSIAFALCLLGLGLLDCKQARDFTKAYFTTAVDKCCAQLSQTISGRGHAPKLLTSISSATILLIAWHMRTAHGATGPHEALRAQALYNQTLSLAQLSGLLFPRSDKAPSALFLDRAQPESPSSGSPSSTEEHTWMAWARVESVKRLIATLVVVDAWWAYNLNTPPIIRARSVWLELVCPDELFQCPSARSWRRLIDGGSRVASPQVMLQIQPPLVDLSIAEDHGPLGMMSLLSLLWIWILDLRRRMLPDTSTDNCGGHVLVPVAIYAADESGRGVGHVLNEIYAKIPRSFQYNDTNCVILWHFLNLQLLANVAIFELAAGREGAEAARPALRDIATWAQTDYARRACLHGAGIYTAMNRRRINDGTMLFSETALFVAALVVGLYAFMMRPGVGPSGVIDGEPYELLDDVDWPGLGVCGLQAPSTSSPNHSNPAWNTEIAALRFIREGRAFSFSGVACEGGYHPAKMILLDFANVLEEAGKRDAKGLCHILRIMSDSLLDINDDD